MIKIVSLRHKIGGVLIQDLTPKVAAESIRRIVLFGKEKGVIKALKESKPLPTPKSYQIRLPQNVREQCQSWLGSNYVSADEKVQILSELLATSFWDKSI